MHAVNLMIMNRNSTCMVAVTRLRKTDVGIAGNNIKKQEQKFFYLYTSNIEDSKFRVKLLNLCSKRESDHSYCVPVCV